jgi:diguanylate cyclase (GGDEF)-like protein
VTEQLGLAIANTRLTRTMERLAMTDPLTGLGNARSFDTVLRETLLTAEASGQDVGVLFLDLDHFKVFNDTYGHPAGDRLLKEASAAWHGALRAVDLLARYGGEEFVVLLPDAGEAEARQIMERALAATPQGQTFSAGIAVWDGSETPDQLVARADAALYEAKAAGRNRVMV